MNLYILQIYIYVYIQHFHNLVLENNDINKHLIYIIYSLGSKQNSPLGFSTFSRRNPAIDSLNCFQMVFLHDPSFQPFSLAFEIKGKVLIHIYTYSEDIFRSSSYVRGDKFTNVVSTQVITQLLPQTPLYEKKIILIISHVN